MALQEREPARAPGLVLAQWEQVFVMGYQVQGLADYAEEAQSRVVEDLVSLEAMLAHACWAAGTVLRERVPQSAEAQERMVQVQRHTEPVHRDNMAGALVR